MTEGFLAKAYSYTSSRASERFYDEWAASYDAEVGENGYVTADRCAAALAEHAEDLTAPVLDLGCGTGLSGLALRRAGFTTIDGWDVSAEMLKQSEAHDGLYRDLKRIEPDAPLDAPDSDFANANAAGVMNPGLAPPEAFDQVLDLLPRDGCFSFSLNDHAMEDGAHEWRMRELLDCGAARLLFKEYGEHLPGTGLKAWVYVMQKA